MAEWTEEKAWTVISCSVLMAITVTMSFYNYTTAKTEQAAFAAGLCRMPSTGSELQHFEKCK